MTFVAVTGANGFIGKALVDALLARGDEVLCLGRSQEALADIPAAAKAHVTDFSVDDLTAAMAGVDKLVHLAGRRSVRGEDMELVADFAHTGLMLLDGLLRAARENNIKQVVQASSIAVYSNANKKPYRETETPVPASNYGLAKLFCEDYANWWSARYKIPVAHLRFSACYGAGEKLTPALMKISDQAFRSIAISVSNGGNHAIDQIHVNDAVSAVLCALDANRGGAFNIGAGRAIPLSEIVQTAVAVFESTAGLTIEPADDNNGPKVDNHMMIGHATQHLGWEPTTPLRDGMQHMRLEWMALKTEK